MWKARLEEALQRLHRDVAVAPGDPPGPAGSAAWRATLMEQRRYSRIFLLEPGTDAQRQSLRQDLDSDALVLKLYHAVQAQRRQDEFDDLQRVHRMCGPRTRGSVVRPVAVYADLGVVITARAAGTAADRMVQNACKRTATADGLATSAALCTRAGVWLAAFQAEQPAVQQASPHLATVDDFVRYVDERLQRMQAWPFALASADRQRTCAALQAVLSPEVLQPVVWSHSDFGPHNLLGDAERVTVLDFELLPQHPWFDAAYFVESLAGFTGMRFSPEHVARLERVFLSGYGVRGDEPLFLALRLRHLVCTAASRRARKGRLPFLEWGNHATLRRRLLHLVQQLESVAPAAAAIPQPA